MSKSTFYILLSIAITIGVVLWGAPLIKKALIGESWEVQIEIKSVVEDEVETTSGDIVPRTIVALNIFFPMGTAPDTTKELQVIDDEGHPVEVVWSAPEKDDLPDKNKTRWIIKEVFFPMGFRQGTLKTQTRELKQIRLPQPPFNAP